MAPESTKAATMKSKEIKEVQDVCERGVHAVAVSEDGRWVVTAGGDGSHIPGELKARENPGKFTLQGTNTYLIGEHNPYTRFINTGLKDAYYIPQLKSALSDTCKLTNPNEPQIFTDVTPAPSQFKPPRRSMHKFPLVNGPSHSNTTMIMPPPPGTTSLHPTANGAFLLHGLAHSQLLHKRLTLAHASHSHPGTQYALLRSPAVH
ncbi:hypothetical protein BDR05DRAFT_1003429 [Suillus weaverae]|nr:hypothetical protein BDR05DRAFT_1003429 [Suillus weaverae]